MKSLPFRLLVAGIALTLAASATAQPKRCEGPGCSGELVYIGTHGSTIEAAALDPATGRLTSLGSAASIERPTWLVADPVHARLFSVSETGNDSKSQGGVYALAIDRGSGRLAILGRSDSGGGGATHLTYDAGAQTLFVANYGTGDVAAIPLAADGQPGPVQSVVRNVGSGPSPRQKNAHAHGVTVAPGGRYLLSPDLGADRVFVYRIDPRTHALSPAPVPNFALPPGSGPRHLVFSRDGRFAFVDTELTGEVHVLRWDARSGTLAPVSHIALDAADFAGPRSAAELALSADGRYLYLSNRGANSIQVFAVDPATGTLHEIQRIDAGGKVPWSFAIDPSGRWLLVADEASSNVADFAIEPRSGRLSATANSLAIGKPVAIAFDR